MATYIRLVRLTDEGRKTVRDSQKLSDAAARILKEHGARRVSGWATLGRYDFVVVVEAPDDATMMQASAKIAATGLVVVETLPAIPTDEFMSGL